MLNSGYTAILLQIGKGKYLPKLTAFETEKCRIDVDYFRFKPTIKEEMMSADLIISHAVSL